MYGTRRRKNGNCQHAGSDTSINVFSNFNIQRWPGWLNANGYKYAMRYLNANIKDACYSSKATLP